MSNTQQKLWDKPLTPMLDEYFNPKHIKPTMVDIVEEEMESMGLNVNNPDDIKKYWEKKGIPNVR